jgi:hypothetical protein
MVNYVHSTIHKDKIGVKPVNDCDFLNTTLLNYEFQRKIPEKFWVIDKNN